MGLHIVLVEPEIPQNTGNIARTCAATGASLHLVEPLGFSLEDRYLKRAGLDYWHLLSMRNYPSLELFMKKHRDKSYWLVTTKGGHVYSDVTFPFDCYLLFGKETEGLPEDLLRAYPGRCIRIPMIAGARSLNLSNAVAIVTYEYLRQHGFLHLQKYGSIPD
jgi:tRNA (cytidine/uridine-2'-O-)-methyltransferase